MTEDPTAKLLASMRRDAVPVASEDRERAQRDRVVARVDEVAADVHRRRRQRRTLSVALAAAAAVLLVVGLRTLPITESPRGPVLTGGVLLADGMPVQPGTELGGLPLRVPAEGRAQLALGSDARVVASPSSAFRLERLDDASGTPGERLHLVSGSVRLRVPKLPPGVLLAVVTPHGSVEVHGTVFRVAVAAGDGQKETTVDVTEGEVHVRTDTATVVLRPGDRWSSAGAGEGASTPAVPLHPEAPSAGEQKEAAVKSADTAASARTPPVQRRGGRSDATKSPDQDVHEASQLADQNRLYRSAMHAKRNGMNQLALSRLDDLLHRYPESPLAENAHVERLRLLQSLGRRDQASRASEEYLERYPRGFAVEEAEGAAGRGSASETDGKKP